MIDDTSIVNIIRGKSEHNNNRLYDIREAAIYLNVSRYDVNCLIDAGHLTQFTRTRKVFVTKGDLDKYLQHKQEEALPNE